MTCIDSVPTSRHAPVHSDSYSEVFLSVCAKSFLKTVKREEISAKQYQYRNLGHLRTNMAAFIDEYYNRTRLYSALGYPFAKGFERVVAAERLPAAATREFLRPREEFRLRRSDRRK
jgi:hypothetical protein